MCPEDRESGGPGVSARQEAEDASPLDSVSSAAIPATGPACPAQPSVAVCLATPTANSNHRLLLSVLLLLDCKPLGFLPVTQGPSVVPGT